MARILTSEPSVVRVERNTVRRLVRTAVYLGVQLGPTGRATLTLPTSGVPGAAAQSPALRIDASGAGVFTAEQPPTALLDERASLDTTPPTIELANTGAPAPRWRVRDDGAGVLRAAVSLDGGPLRDTAASGELLSLGRHRVQVVAVDRAGNASVRELVLPMPQSASR